MNVRFCIQKLDIVVRPLYARTSRQPKKYLKSQTVHKLASCRIFICNFMFTTSHNIFQVKMSQTFD
jgi:hypothetical protein